jgi:hypothetical protein
LGGILLGGMSVEKPRIALGAAGYAFATRSDDGVGQVLGVVVVLCMGLVGDPSFNLPVLFLES